MRIQRYRIFVACLGIAFYPAMAYANDLLTEEKVKAFYDESFAVQMKTIEETLVFYNKHMRDDAKATLNLVSRVKGNTTDKQVIVFDKPKLLAETKKGDDISTLKNIEGSVISVKISVDGKTAKVKNSFVSESVARIPINGKIVSVNIEQSALCDDDLIMTEKNIIQYTNSICNAESMMDLPME